MLKRFIALFLVATLTCMLGGTSAVAQVQSAPESTTKILKVGAESVLAKTESRPNDQLRAAILNLVADAKAGKVEPAAYTQTQPKMSNGLSMKTKIAIGVGIAIVVLILIAVHAKNHLVDCGNRCVL